MLEANYTKQVHKKNNFDFLRLLFATSVIITHSYPLSGIPECDWLCQLTDNQMLMSHIGVKGFFVLSGYLIFQSLERSNSILDFFWKRSLRLFPALLVVLVLTLLLVPFVYESSVPLLYNRSFWTYLPNNLVLYKTQYLISGVFENNPYRGAINGSLWTIPYEFTMYLLIILLFPIKKRSELVGYILGICFVLLTISNLFFYEKMGEYSYILRGQSMLELSAFFIAGAILANSRIKQILHKNNLLLLSALFLALSVYLNVFSYFKYMLLPLVVILFGQSSTPVINSIGGKIGDLSYGIYIYGFPVQQALMHYFKLTYLELIFSSLPITYILAYLSWHLVEKKALKMKNLQPKAILARQLATA